MNEGSEATRLEVVIVSTPVNGSSVGEVPSARGAGMWRDLE